MPLPTGEVIGILGDNLRLRGSVLPIPPRKSTRWARGLGLPRGGATVLYTGQMYQIIPYIEAMVQVEQRIADTPLTRYAALGRHVNRFVNITALMTHPSRKVRAAYDETLRNIARLLQQAGAEFGYLYEDDLYSGALAHDMGLDEVVAEHARRVVGILRAHGVKNVITVDPHTTTMLRTVYPTVVPGLDIGVRSYLEVLASHDPPVRKKLDGTVAIHDSCVYARYENVVQEPRRLLRDAGLTVAEPEYAGLGTWCCGGPVESLYPVKAVAVARTRVSQLQAVSDQAVTMCPLCLVNLRKAADVDLHVDDISYYLVRAYGAEPTRKEVAQ